LGTVFQQWLNSFVWQNPASSTHVCCTILRDSPPSMKAREITEKGTLSQAAVLKNRAPLLQRLYQESTDGQVLKTEIQQ
jgi:hypothetical protein